ncbi:MAG: hypothetical protein NWS31_08120 [Crocinitomicaceae bacterium]|nr:hypothetical protein [Crocinitomicaceae bacterium]MDP4805847.1 hypothetical protein [Crocinitomicaceae bacterium]MDP5042339.1 hypothetical protein [Crocinitomicaceae bacterium]
MKKILLFVGITFLVSCSQTPKEAPVNPKMDVFNKNVATAKAWLRDFMENDSTTLFSDKYATKDFIWSPPAVGMDSLPREQWENQVKIFMSIYENKMLEDAQYSAALNEENLPDGNVRVYGTWNSTFAKTGKKSKLKWCAVIKFNEEGKIVHQMEWFDSADLSKEFD